MACYGLNSDKSLQRIFGAVSYNLKLKELSK